ncbi:MAG: DUF192 domain-containing protein [Rhodobacteraceae bacterium]|nr:DUF192 domain-containing protein [Paracoccaceae bacterium]
MGNGGAQRRGAGRGCGGASRLMRAGAAALLAAISATAALAGAECAQDAAILKTDTGALVRFGIEIAATPQARARGLMYRDQLAASQGMLFVYDSPEHARFWMKNTEIPLDMVFFDATPRQTALHLQHQQNAGAAINHRFIIGLGVFRHPLVPQGNAAWPCAGP